MIDKLLGLSGISINIATTDAEREACFALRYRVYVEEQGRQPPTADHVRKLDRNADDAGAVHFCAYSNGTLVGTARVHHGSVTGIPAVIKAAFGLPEDDAALAQAAMVGRLAIDAEHRGGKVIVALLRACFAWLSADGRSTRQVYILALDEPKLVAMYRLLGFKQLAPERKHAIDLGVAVPMVVTIGG